MLIFPDNKRHRRTDNVQRGAPTPRRGAFESSGALSWNRSGPSTPNFFAHFQFSEAQLNISSYPST